jgi:RNA polymerase sigma factor (sigma-70 family)
MNEPRSSSSDEVPAASRLDAIATNWSLVRKAHAAGHEQTAAEARNALVMRYARAIRRFVGGIVKHREEADELAQELMVKLLRGDFAGADPGRGSFRSLLKTAVRNLMRTQWTRQKRTRSPAIDLDVFAAEADDRLEQSWLRAWQQTVLDHAWSALKEVEQRNPAQAAHTLLKLRADFPDETSEQLAARLGQRLGTSFRADAFRQMLRRARLRFAELLIDEVKAGLDEPTPERIEEELAALGLLDHARDFLPRDWKQQGRLSEGEGE